jgi:hypothetical protein
LGPDGIVLGFAKVGSAVGSHPAIAQGAVDTPAAGPGVAAHLDSSSQRDNEEIRVMRRLAFTVPCLAAVLLFAGAARADWGDIGVGYQTCLEQKALENVKSSMSDYEIAMHVVNHRCRRELGDFTDAFNREQPGQDGLLFASFKMSMTLGIIKKLGEARKVDCAN